MLDEFRNKRLTSELGLPDRTTRPPNPAQARRRLYAHEVLVRNPPGYPLTDRYPLVSGFKDVVYLCVRSIMDAMAGVTVRVTQRRAKGSLVRKALPTANSQADDYEYGPAPHDHPLCKLMRRPNSVEPLCDWLAFWVLQNELLGESYVWMNPNQLGTFPAELWVIPAPLTNPLPISEQYPDGGVRVMSLMSGSLAGAAAFSGVEIDNNELLRMAEPHPLWRWSAYSRQTAGGRSIDVLNAILESTKSAMDKAFSARTIVNVPGTSQDQVDDVMNRMRERYAGAKGEQLIGLGSDEEIKVTQTEAMGAREMDYPNALDRMIKIACGLFGTSDTVIGLSAADSYAGFWAKLKQFQTLCLIPRARRYAAHLTMHLAERFWPEDGLVVEFDLPKIDDQEEQRANVALQPGPLYTMNEVRALYNLDPVEGGDVPASAYGQPQAAAPGAGADPTAGGNMPAPGQGHPLDALGDGVLEALGVQGGQGSDPTAADHGGAPPGSGLVLTGTPPRWHSTAAKAFGRQFDETKVKRDAGRFASKPGAGAKPQVQAGQGSGSTVPKTAETAVPDAVKQHPRVRTALSHLAGKAAGIAAKVTQALTASGLTPEDLVGNFDDWSRIFCTHHADVVGQTLGVDALTAGQILSHLAASAFTAIKGRLGGQPGQQAPATTPDAPHDGPHAGGPPHPDNPGGRGSLPNRLGKAFDAVEFGAALAELGETL